MENNSAPVSNPEVMTTSQYLPPAQVIAPPPAIKSVRSKSWIWITLAATLGLLMLGWWGWSQINFVIFDKAASDQSRIMIRYLKLSKPGYLVVMNNEGGLPSDQIGTSRVIPGGMYDYVWIDLYDTTKPDSSPLVLTPGTRVFIRIYHDADGDERPEIQFDTIVKEYIFDY